MSGFAVTDMYEGDYMSKPHEVLAGNDIPDNYPGNSGTGVLSGGTNLGFEFEAYGPDGGTPNAQIAQAMRESAHRILYTVLHSRGMDGIDLNTHILEITPWWQVTLISLEIVFGVASAGIITLVVFDIFRKKRI